MAPSVLDLFRQNLFVPKPTFTVKNAPDQTGKIHIVTGGYSGVGYELASLLFKLNATVYIAGRDAIKADAAIKKLQQADPISHGHLYFLKLDLADLKSIKASAEEFMRREQKLHVLTNNAGINMDTGAPVEQKKETALGIELQLATNCLGPFLFTQLLLPILQRTAAAEPACPVRVTWAASFAVEINGPEGILMQEDGTPDVRRTGYMKYYSSKVGNLFYSKEFARHYGQDGIVSVAFNPGNINSELLRHFSATKKWLMGMIFYPPKMGAHTELYAALSPDLTMDNNGAYVYPFGRIGGLKALENAVQPFGATVPNAGKAGLFWAWSEKMIRPYL